MLILHQCFFCTRFFFSLKAFYLLQKVCIFLWFLFSDESSDFYWMNTFISFLCFDLDKFVLIYNFHFFVINELLDKIKDLRVLEGHSQVSQAQNFLFKNHQGMYFSIFFVSWSRFWFLLNYQLFSSFLLIHVLFFLTLILFNEWNGGQDRRFKRSWRPQTSLLSTKLATWFCLFYSRITLHVFFLFFFLSKFRFLSNSLLFSSFSPNIFMFFFLNFGFA